MEKKNRPKEKNQPQRKSKCWGRGFDFGWKNKKKKDSPGKFYKSSVQKTWYVNKDEIFSTGKRQKIEQIFFG